MLFSVTLFTLVLNTIGTLAHGNDILSPQQLHALAKRQHDVVKCRSSLQARHHHRMAALDSKRGSILASRKSATSTTSAVTTSTATAAATSMPSMSEIPTGTAFISGGPMGSGMAGGGGVGGAGAQTTYNPTATAIGTFLTVFPSTTGSAAPASQTTQASNGACALSPEEEEGPYYIPGELVRSNLVENQTGIPFYAEFAIIDTNTCAPLVSAAIDIWSCNATGDYAGFSGTGDSSQYNGEIAHVGDTNDVGSVILDDSTFLRGQQLTDGNGAVQFTTLMPGWYAGRAAHIHIRVHVGGELTSNRTYVGGNLTHTGQSFFGEDLYSQIENVFPYSSDTNVRTTNDEDRPWTQQNGTYSAWNLYYVVDGDITQGLIGYLNFAVDSTAIGEDGV